MTDVRDTIDCTILAVEKVFSFGGIFRHPSDYEKRCKGDAQQNTSPPEVPPSEVRYDSYTPAETQNAAAISHEIADDVKKELSRELDATMSNVNQTINELFDVSGAHREVENVEIALKNDTNRLTEISALLNKEINDLSGTIKSQFENLNLDRKKSTVDDVLKEIKLLQEVEYSNKNAKATNKIRQVFDEVLGVLNAEKSAKTLSNEDEVKEIIKDLKSMSQDTDINKDVTQWKKDEKQILENIETKISGDSKKFFAKDSVTPVPKSFKDIAKSLFKHPELPPIEDTDVESDEADDSGEEPELSESSESAPDYDTQTNEELEIADAPPTIEEPTDLSKLDASALNSFFAPPSKESQKEAVKDAEKLIERSKFTNTIMNNFFNRPRDDDDVPSVFDNPDLLNFGDDYS